MTTSSTQQPSPVIEMEEAAAGLVQDASVIVAEHINWTVRAGDFWVVAGLQGSGKSDFLMMAGGVTAPVQGQYRLLGEPMPIFDVSRLPHRLRLGLVFDGGHLLHPLTVRENIALPLCYHRNQSKAEADREVTPWLETLGLTPWADSTPGAMGTNWRKRAGLARALILQPDVLLVDNPLGGLDLHHTQWWLSFLAELARGHPLRQQRPLTLVVTTSDLRPWQNLATQFAVLKQKRLTVLGSWAQIRGSREDNLRELWALPAAHGEEEIV